VEDARRFGFSTSTIFGENPLDSLEKLNQAVTDGNSVIVDYLDGKSLKNDGHYSVFLGSTGNKVILWDPSLGKQRAMDQSDFISHWKDTTIGGKLFKYWALILHK
jgi:predicted double-glycine peptidase